MICKLLFYNNILTIHFVIQKYFMFQEFKMNLLNSHIDKVKWKRIQYRYPK